MTEPRCFVRVYRLPPNPAGRSDVELNACAWLIQPIKTMKIVDDVIDVIAMIEIMEPCGPLERHPVKTAQNEEIAPQLATALWMVGHSTKRPITCNCNPTVCVVLMLLLLLLLRTSEHSKEKGAHTTLRSVGKEQLFVIEAPPHHLLHPAGPLPSAEKEKASIVPPCGFSSRSPSTPARIDLHSSGFCAIPTSTIAAESRVLFS